MNKIFKISLLFNFFIIIFMSIVFARYATQKQIRAYEINIKSIERNSYTQSEVENQTTQSNVEKTENEEQEENENMQPTVIEITHLAE